MKSIIRSLLIALTAYALYTAYSPSFAGEGRARSVYPAVLHGVWEAGVPVCKLPGNPDSDVRMEIQAKKLVDYEEWNEPVRVVQISTNPRAWKIVSKLHLDDDVIQVEDIFVLSAEDSGRLTVVNNRTSMSYLRCN